MLCQHLYSSLLFDRRIDVFVQTFKKSVKFFSCLVVRVYQIRNLLYVSFGYLCHILSPLFPIAFVAHLFNHTSIDNGLHFLKLQLHLLGNSFFNIFIANLFFRCFRVLICTRATKNRTSQKNILWAVFV